MVQALKEILKSTLLSHPSLAKEQIVNNPQVLELIESVQITPINKKIDFHYCSNVLFRLKNFFKLNQHETSTDINNNFEQDLKPLLLQNKIIEDVEFLNGYINFKMSPIFFAKMTQEILNNDIFPKTGLKKDGTKCKVNVEYCSINPTGFLHIGHARNAILGDAIARMLEKAYFEVTKEYYINDSGNQINLLAQSVRTRCIEQTNQNQTIKSHINNTPEYNSLHANPSEEKDNENKNDSEFIKQNNTGAKHKAQQMGPAENITEEIAYKGPEIKEIAKLVKYDDDLDKIGQIAIKYFLNNIKKDLAALKIHHDVFISENDIRNSHYIEKAIELLKAKGYIYEGTRDGKKAAKGKEENATMLLLKTTTLGDDQDRPLTKADGSWTYLAPDIGYHLNKIDRGFDYLICVLGADHDSYKRRLEIAVKLLKEDIKHKLPIVQMVSFEHDGKHVKFSKRAGNAITVHDFIQEIHPDILRYMMLSKTEGTPFVFDYESACTLSMKNPVFYIQYANARAHSIFRKTQEQVKLYENSQAFAMQHFQNLIILLGSFKSTLNEAADLLAPHIIANYTYKLAEAFHKLWQIGTTDHTARFIIEANKTETQTRLAIIQALLNVLSACLEILAINAPQSMD